MEKIKIFLKARPYLWWCLFLPIYLAVFFTLEHFVAGPDYWATQTVLDQYIPFCEYFAPFYVLWSPMLVAVGLYLIVKDPEGFRRYIWMLMLSFFSATLFCALVPNGQDLRPAVMPRDNVCAWIVSYTYSIDTNTNVFPSVHVLGVVAAASSVWRTKGLCKGPWRWIMALYGALVVISTLLIKQHAVIDVLAAIPWGLLSYWIVYGLIGRHRAWAYDRQNEITGREHL